MKREPARREGAKPVEPGAPALHAPWRAEYLEGLEKEGKTGGPEGPAGGPGATGAGQAGAGGDGAGGAGGAAGGGGAAGAKRSGAAEPEPASFLREYWLTPERDEQNLVVGRTADGIILLNRYPYAGGHLLVALGEPRGRLLDYTPQQRASLWELTALAAALMERVLRPQGINYGINEGRAAGAGVPQHLHVHLVPRWHGDVNFMAAVGNVRVIPSALERMAERYREAWAHTR